MDQRLKRNHVGPGFHGLGWEKWETNAASHGPKEEAVSLAPLFLPKGLLPKGIRQLVIFELHGVLSDDCTDLPSH